MSRPALWRDAGGFDSTVTGLGTENGDLCKGLIHGATVYTGSPRAKTLHCDEMVGPRIDSFLSFRKSGVKVSCPISTSAWAKCTAR